VGEIGSRRALIRPSVLATLAPIVIQPYAVVLWALLPPVLSGETVTLQDVSQISVYVVVFAATFVLVLGVPAFFLLRRFGRATWLPVGFAGFLSAGIPAAVFAWPGHAGSWNGTWHGLYVDFVRDGVPTLYGWLNFAEGVGMFGSHGLVGGLAFLAVWRRCGRDSAASQRDELRH
jgi:hypothetical protein